MKRPKNMRWIILWTIVFIGHSLVWAQEIDDIKLAINNQEYDEASILINRFLDKPGEANKSQPWYYRGFIYAAIVDDVRGANNLDSLALFKSHTSYLKAISLNTDVYADSAKVGLDSLYTTAINFAGRQYSRANDLRRASPGQVPRGSRIYTYYRSAVESAKIAQQLSPEDTLAYNLAFLAAYEIRDFETYLYSLEKLAQIATTPERKYAYYESLVRFSRDVLNDKQQAVRLLNKAIEAFPDSAKFQTALLNLTVEEGNQQKILERAKEQIRLNPHDPVNYFNLAVIYQQVGNDEEAIDNYQVCIRLDSSYFDAYYNLGGIYYNRGANYLRQITEGKEFTFTDYHKRGRELEAKANQDFLASLPYFQICERIDPANKQVLKPLYYIYKRLGNEEELQKIYRKLEYLGHSYGG